MAEPLDDVDDAASPGAELELGLAPIPDSCRRVIVANGFLRVQLTGHPDDVKTAAAELREIFDIVTMSDSYPGRTGDDVAHRWATVLLRSRPTGPG